MSELAASTVQFLGSSATVVHRTRRLLSNRVPVLVKANMKPGIRWLFWILLGIILILVHVKLWPYAYDDAYIHIRIADHLASLGVPYYNPGEAVMASSSTGWTIFLFILFRLTGVHSLMVAIINALLTLAGAFVYTCLVKYAPSANKLPFVISLFPLCYVGIMLHASIGLMETPLALLILGGALLLWIADNQYSKYSWVLFGALPFFRLEFIVFVVLFAAYSLVLKKIGLINLLTYLAIGALPFLCLLRFVFFWNAYSEHGRSEIYCLCVAT